MFPAAPCAAVPHRRVGSGTHSARCALRPGDGHWNCPGPPIQSRNASVEDGTATRTPADMRVGLDLQGCLQYSTEGLFCAQGIRIGWLQPWSARCYSCRCTAVCVQGVRGSAPSARSGMPSGHAVSLSDSQEECVTRRSVLTATWPLTGIMSFRRSSLFGLIGRSGLLRSLRFPAGPSEAGTCWFPGGM
jgi:hypothetical protein